MNIANIPNQLEEGDLVIVNRFQKQAAKINRDKWEQIEHYPEDASYFQVGTAVAVSALGHATHFDVGAGHTEARISNSKEVMRIREVYKLKPEYETAASKVVGQVFSTFDAIEATIRQIAGEE